MRGCASKTVSPDSGTFAAQVMQAESKQMISRIACAGLLVAALLIGACSSHESRHGQQGQDEHSGRQSEQRGHAQGQQQHQQESAVQYDKTDTYDQTRNGSRLILEYSAAERAFVGTVENTTDGALTRVRVEVHLSNGAELGPTTPGDLAPGDSRAIRLEATEEPFDTWNSHPEVGEEEANHQSDRE